MSTVFVFWCKNVPFHDIKLSCRKPFKLMSKLDAKKPCKKPGWKADIRSTFSMDHSGLTADIDQIRPLQGKTSLA